MRRIFMAPVTGLAIVIGSAGGASGATVLTVTSATTEKVCSGLDSGKIDVKDGTGSVTVSAPEGKLIDGYCVKAGSANGTGGPVNIDVNPPQQSVTITYPSGKDISHYSVSYTTVLTPTFPTPTPTQTPTPKPTPTQTPTPKPTPTQTPTPPVSKPPVSKPPVSKPPTTPGKPGQTPTSPDAPSKSTPTVTKDDAPDTDKSDEPARPSAVFGGLTLVASLIAGFAYYLRRRNLMGSVND